METATNVADHGGEEAAERSALRRTLLMLIAIGGSAVLGSYVLAFVVEPDIRSGLWGGIPEGGLRTFYTVNMLLAAVGFFPVTYLLGFATDPRELAERAGASFQTLLGSYAAILIASALWLPLTALYIRQPSTVLWWAIRIDLLVVGIGASMLAWMAIQRARRGGPPVAWLAVIAVFFFWLQTAILDALVWPWFYTSA